MRSRARAFRFSRRCCFFQAEAGIRDHCVPGVQTCALPILLPPIESTWRAMASRSAEAISRPVDSIGGNMDAFTAKECICFNIKVLDEQLSLAMDGLSRSEERRVGEEGRSRWSPDHLKKKK